MIKCLLAVTSVVMLSLLLSERVQPVDAARARGTVLMPYPIFNNQNGDEFLILGTKKAKDLVQQKRIEKLKHFKEKEEIKKLKRAKIWKKTAREETVQDDQDQSFVRRTWVPTQIELKQL